MTNVIISFVKLRILFSNKISNSKKILQRATCGQEYVIYFIDMTLDFI